MASYLFVYGTLMRKLPPNDWSSFLQKNAEYIGEAKTTGELYLVASYPGLVLNSNKDVFGEVYKVLDAERLFSFLDEYEDYRALDHKNSLYTRAEIEVRLVPSLKSIIATSYLFNRDTNGLELIQNGRFETISNNTTFI